MLKSNPRPARARAKASIKTTSRKGASAVERRDMLVRNSSFLPLSISIDSFLVDHSDASFRQLMFHVLGTSAMILRARERFAAYIGVTAPQYSMMLAIAEAGSATVSQIAARLHVSSPFVTAEIGRLIKRGIIRRTPNAQDARSSMLTFTPIGEDLIRRLGPYRRTANDIIFGSFTSAEAGQFAEIMARLYGECERALHELDSPKWRDTAPASSFSERPRKINGPRRRNDTKS